MIDANDVSAPLEEYVFLEYRVRLMVHKSGLTGEPATLDELFDRDYKLAIDVDVTSRAPIGRAVKCPDQNREGCERVAIDTVDYPWGLEHYKKNIYCPHCDGGEDVG